jgi:LCP family protein required for cell wall assembly
MNKWRKKIVVLIATILAMIVVATVVVVAGINIQNSKAKEEDKRIAEELREDEPETKNYLTIDGKKYQYNHDVSAVLFMGIDQHGAIEEKENAGYSGQSDSLILFVMDKGTKKTQMLEISRNAMVPLQIYGIGGEKLGTEKGQIALQYAYGDGKRKSCQLTKNAVSELLYGIKIDSYLAMTIEGIRKATDLIGGVTLTVPEDYTYIDPSFQKGATVTLKGELAEKYVRTRDIEVTGSNQERMQRQTQFLHALASRMKSSGRGNSAWYAKLMNSMQEYLITDITADDIETLSTYELDKTIIMPGEEVAGEKHDEFYVDDEALYQLIVELFYEPVEAS